MPIYEYRCSECGFQKEYLQKVSDPRLTVCPECRKETFSKMLTAAGFQLKGSGWYATDFKGAPKASTKPGDKAAGDGKSESKSESKSETAATPATPAAPSTPSGGTTSS
jgi:putative FmdB family regulatory protein